MTPEEFYLKLTTLITEYTDEDGEEDTERLHLEMDCLMCHLLRNLGYEKGVDVFLNTVRWYS